MENFYCGTCTTPCGTNANKNLFFFSEQESLKEFFRYNVGNLRSLIT